MPESNRKKYIDPELSLKDLLDIKHWQKTQDKFSVVTDISIRTTDTQGNLLTRQSNEPRLCSELVWGSGKKEMLCSNCLPTFLSGQAIVDKNLSFICQLGLHNFILPIRLKEIKVLGYIVLGPVILAMRKDKEEYKEIADQLNLDLEDFWSALLEIKVVSLHGMRSLVELVEDVCEYTVNLVYRQRIKERGVMMVSDSAKIERVLDVLLDVAFEVSQADIGSVMFFDKGQKNLTIRSSRGIPEEIALNTKVRLGEGISGIVAREGKSFLIDDDIKDNRIRSYLKRPYLGSSMVIPLKAENRIMGVMSLGVLKTSPVRFSTANVGVMNKLIELATVAIPFTK